MSTKSKIIITFDDARSSKHFVDDILIPLNIPATFFITTGVVDGSFIMENVIPMTKEEVCYLSKNNLFEIAAHGDMHRNDLEDIKNGIKKMKEWKLIEGTGFIGFSSPGTEMEEEYIESQMDALKNIGLSYIRLAQRYKKNKKIKILFRKISRVIHSPFLYSYSYSDTLIEKQSNFIFYSVPIINDITFEQVKSLIKRTVKEEKSLVLMFHSISNKNETNVRDPWVWNYKKFKQMCLFLKSLEEKKLLTICKLIDIEV